MKLIFHLRLLSLTWMEPWHHVVNWRQISPGMWLCLAPAFSVILTIYTFLRSFNSNPKTELPQRNSWSLLQKSSSSQPCRLKTMFRSQTDQGKSIRYFYESTGPMGWKKGKPQKLYQIWKTSMYVTEIAWPGMKIKECTLRNLLLAQQLDVQELRGFSFKLVHTCS